VLLLPLSYDMHPYQDAAGMKAFYVPYTNPLDLFEK
jgi:hypothetical protein